jgi:hypothetical protein
MGKADLQNQIRSVAYDATAIGGGIVIERADGRFDLIEPGTVNLLSDCMEAHDFDGTEVQIPYAMIAGVTVELLDRSNTTPAAPAA